MKETKRVDTQARARIRNSRRLTVNLWGFTVLVILAVACRTFGRDAFWPIFRTCAPIAVAVFLLGCLQIRWMFRPRK